MSIFIKVDKFRGNEREEKLRKCVQSICKAEPDKSIFLIEQEAFDHFPETRWLYWLQEKIRKCFLECNTLKQHGLIAAAGLQTNDDFRFIRSWCEVPIAEIGRRSRWSNFYKGGEFSPLLDDINLVVLWADSGYGIKQHTIELGNSPSRHVVNENYYFNQGLAYINVSSIGFSAQIFPKDVIFSIQGQYIKPNDWVNDLGILCSSLSRSLLKIINPGRHYQAGQVQLLPYVGGKLSSNTRKKILDACNEKYEQLSWLETSRFFRAPLILNFSGDFQLRLTKSLKKIDDLLQSNSLFQKNIDDEIFELYGQDEGGINFVKNDNEDVIENPGLIFVSDLNFLKDGGKREGWILYSYISFLCGVAFSRWKKNIAELKFIRIGDTEDIPDLPSHPPAYNEGVGPVVFSADHLCEILKSLSMDSFEIDLEDTRDLIQGFTGIEAFLSRRFFDFHYSYYSKSRRYAPIYWPLQTPSGCYTLWIYYHRLNEQTLYTCVNDFVEPKLQQVEQELSGLRSKSACTTQEEKELEKLSDLASEVRDLRDELLRLAKFWKPNLNDGVQITAAPLWKLFQHKAWQKKLKETWESLEKGDYDWAHLACSIWPRRVLEKCHQDRSLAIAHDVEDVFWHEIEVPIIRRGRDTGEAKLEWHPRDLSEVELNAVIQDVIKERGL